MRSRSGASSPELQAACLLGQELAVADQRGHRRQQLLAHVGKPRPALAIGDPAGSVTAVARRRGSWRAGAEQALDLLEQARRARPAWCRSRRSPPPGLRPGRSTSRARSGAMTGMARGLRRRLEPPGRLPAVEHRQAHVHQDQIRPLAPLPGRSPARRRPRSAPRSPGAAAGATACRGSSRCPRHQELRHSRFPGNQSPTGSAGAGAAPALARRGQQGPDVVEQVPAPVGPLLQHLDHAAVQPVDLLAREVLGGHDDHRDRRARRPRAASRSSTSKPSISGIIRSSRISAGRDALELARAPRGRWRPRPRSSPPSAACAAACPAVVGSSSTTRTCADAVAATMPVDRLHEQRRGRSAWSG